MKAIENVSGPDSQFTPQEKFSYQWSSSENIYRNGTGTILSGVFSLIVGLIWIRIRRFILIEYSVRKENVGGMVNWMVPQSPVAPKSINQKQVSGVDPDH